VVEEGAIITLSNTPLAVRMGTTNELSEKLNAKLIPADATSVADLEQVFSQSMEALGGPIDFVLHSIGMSPNVRKKRTYDDLDYDMLTTTLDISAISFHKMLQVAKKMNAINEGGSVVALTYMAAQRTVFGYNDMADAKAMLESIARSFGYIYGREHNVRINTISQSPTVTTAGSGVKGMDGLLDFSERMSPIGNATAADCADYCVVIKQAGQYIRYVCLGNGDHFSIPGNRGVIFDSNRQRLSHRQSPIRNRHIYLEIEGVFLGGISMIQRLLQGHFITPVTFATTNWRCQLNLKNNVVLATGVANQRFAVSIPTPLNLNTTRINWFNTIIGWPSQ
jgi:enoyl-[acyl-carrier protein] reductase I